MRAGCGRGDGVAVTRPPHAALRQPRPGELNSPIVEHALEGQAPHAPLVLELGHQDAPIAQVLPHHGRQSLAHEPARGHGSCLRVWRRCKQRLDSAWLTVVPASAHEATATGWNTR